MWSPQIRILGYWPGCPTADTVGQTVGQRLTGQKRSNCRLDCDGDTANSKWAQAWRCLLSHLNQDTILESQERPSALWSPGSTIQNQPDPELLSTESRRSLNLWGIPALPIDKRHCLRGIQQYDDRLVPYRTLDYGLHHHGNCIDRHCSHQKTVAAWSERRT